MLSCWTLQSFLNISFYYLRIIAITSVLVKKLQSARIEFITKTTKTNVVKPKVEEMEQSNAMIFMKTIEKIQRFFKTEDHVDDSEN